MSESMVRSRIFSSAWSLSGNLSRLKSANGTKTYSACPPVQPPMSTYPYAEPARAGFTFRHTPVLPSLQLRQRPQAMLKGTEQMSPSLMNCTSLPFSTTSPEISCPRVCPTGAVVRPRTMCWSEPQMLVETIFSITAWGAALVIPIASATSPGTSSFGYSMSSTATSPGPLYTTTLLSAISLVLLSLWSLTIRYGNCYSPLAAP